MRNDNCDNCGESWSKHIGSKCPKNYEKLLSEREATIAELMRALKKVPKLIKSQGGSVIYEQLYDVIELCNIASSSPSELLERVRKLEKLEAITRKDHLKITLTTPDNCEICKALKELEPK